MKSKLTFCSSNANAFNKHELLSPAGNFVSLRAAIQAKADAVYFGITELNMRTKNFKLSDLKKIKTICGKVKRYLTLNTIIYEDELKQAEHIIKTAKPFINAIICWDISIIQLCKKHNIPFHISTQASVSNSQAALFYKKLGAKRIILARECSLKQIKEIKKKTNIELETFIHGAMCVAISGRCFTSQFTFGKSANRGECLQNCRREYIIKDVDEKFKLKLNNNFVLSAKDLCTLEFIEKLKHAGISSFKIEGRNRSPEYVKVVTEVYREALDNKLTKKRITELLIKLKTVYNRDFSSGFYLNQPINEFTNKYGSKATTKKQYVGKITNYYNKNKVAEILVESNVFKKGDKLMIQGPTTGVIMLKVKDIVQNNKKVNKTGRGEITIKANKVRKNDLVYLVL